MRQHTVIRALVLAGTFFTVQLAVGCDWRVCLGFSMALFCGWCACESAAPWRSLLGLLTISLYVKSVLFGCVVKTVFLQPMDEGVHAPVETSAVFALGFAAVWIAVLIQRLLPLPARPLLQKPATPQSSLVLWGIFLGLGGISWLFVFLSQVNLTIRSEADLFASLERIYIVPGMLLQFLPLAPAAAVFYLAQRGHKRLVSHPLVIGSLMATAIPGLLGASKLGVMQPLAAVALSLLLLRGPRHKPLWLLSGASLVIFLLLVFPLVQRSRYVVRQSTLAERLSAIREVAVGIATGTNYGAIFDEALQMEVAPPYLPRALAPLDRFVRYIEASRLVEASLARGYTGFFTISWGLQQIPPRTLSPDKPLASVNNWLGHYTGDVGSGDELTQFAYGFMASFFNAFGYWGAFLGSLLLYLLMTYWLRLFGDDRTGPNIWMLAVFWLFDHALVENSAGAIIASVWIPLPIVFCYGLHLVLSRILCAPIRGPQAAARLRSAHMANTTMPRATHEPGGGEWRQREQIFRGRYGRHVPRQSK